MNISLFQNKKQTLLIGLLGLVLITLIGFFVGSSDLFKGEVATTPDTGILTINQVDQDGNPLLGAVSYDGQSGVINVSDVQHSDDQAVLGDYVLNIAAPNGYKIDHVYKKDLVTEVTSPYLQKIENKGDEIHYQIIYTKVPSTIIIEQSPIMGSVQLIDSQGASTSVSAVDYMHDQHLPGDYTLSITAPTDYEIDKVLNANDQLLDEATNYLQNLKAGETIRYQVFYKQKSTLSLIAAEQSPVAGKIKIVGDSMSLDFGNVSPAKDAADPGKYKLEILELPTGYELDYVSTDAAGANRLLDPYEVDLKVGETITYYIFYKQSAAVAGPNEGTIIIEQSPVAGAVEIVDGNSNTYLFEKIGPESMIGGEGGYSLNVINSPQNYELDYISATNDRSGEISAPYDQPLLAGKTIRYYVFWKSTSSSSSGSGGGSSTKGDIIISQSPVAGAVELVDQNQKSTLYEKMGPDTIPFEAGDYQLNIVNQPQDYVLDRVEAGTGAINAPYSQPLSAGSQITYRVFWKKSQTQAFSIVKSAKEQDIANNNKRIDYEIRIKRLDSDPNPIKITVSDTITGKGGKIEVDKVFFNYIATEYSCNPPVGSSAVCASGSDISKAPVDIIFDKKDDEVVIKYQMFSDNSGQPTNLVEFKNEAQIDYDDAGGVKKTIKSNIISVSVDTPTGGGSKGPGIQVGGGSGGGGNNSGNTGGGASTSGGSVATGGSGSEAQSSVEVKISKFISLDGKNYQSADQVTLEENKKGTLYYKVVAENKNSLQVIDVRIKHDFIDNGSNLIIGEVKKLIGARMQNDGTFVFDDIPGGGTRELYYSVDMESQSAIRAVATDVLELIKYSSPLIGNNPDIELKGIGTKLVTKFSYLTSALPAASETPAKKTVASGVGGGSTENKEVNKSGSGSSSGSVDLKLSAPEKSPDTGLGGGLENSSGSGKVVAQNSEYKLISDRVNKNTNQLASSNSGLNKSGPTPLLALMITFVGYLAYRRLYLVRES